MSRFVRPEVVRLFLSDQARREHQVLLTRKRPKPTDEEIADSEARLAHADELADWIDVKRRLNTGETRAKYTRMYVASLDGTRRVDPQQTGMALVVAYLLDWSLKDDDAKPVSIKGLVAADLALVLDSLDPYDFGQIAALIDWHEDQQDAQRAAEKKTIRAGRDASKAISASPSDVIGPMSTLPN